jgi:hypothetical protein
LSVGKGFAFCENCGKRYSAQELEAFIAGPDDASVKAAKAKNRRFKKLFRKKLKLPGFYWGKGYKCPRNHILIYMQTWRT